MKPIFGLLVVSGQLVNETYRLSEWRALPALTQQYHTDASHTPVRSDINHISFERQSCAKRCGTFDPTL